jgi:hypothetical protein
MSNNTGSLAVTQQQPGSVQYNPYVKVCKTSENNEQELKPLFTHKTYSYNVPPNLFPERKSATSRLTASGNRNGVNEKHNPVLASTRLLSK